MLIKGNEIVTWTIKKFFKVNDIGLKLYCLKVRSTPLPSRRISYQVIGYGRNLVRKVLHLTKIPFLREG
jgi:hypothetical protein